MTATKQPESSVRGWVEEAITTPLKQVSREMFALMVLAGVGVAVGVVTTVLHIANRVKGSS